MPLPKRKKSRSTTRSRRATGNLVVPDMIFSQFPHLPEGEMAKLRAATVNMGVLADAARELGVGPHLHLGRGEELSGGREKSSILADALEALIGAIYLDQGMEAT